MGFSFLLICFIMITILGLKYLKKHKQKIILIPIALISSYLITIFVNTSRIFVSIIIEKQFDSLLSDRPHHIIHQTIGTIINLIFLIIIYYLIERYFKKK